MAIEPSLRFFFYGTLISGGPPRVRDALDRLSDLGPARVPGVLWAIPDPGGWYPALLEGAGRVTGRLYEAGDDFAQADLRALDDYEDFDPHHPAGSLYLRSAVEIAGRTAQLYRYNPPLPAGARPIPDGDFAAWIAREGLAAFAG